MNRDETAQADMHVTGTIPVFPGFADNEKGANRMEEKNKAKKAYETPEARKVDFNYVENVVASGMQDKPPEDPSWWWCSTCRPDLF